MVQWFGTTEVDSVPSYAFNITVPTLHTLRWSDLSKKKELTELKEHQIEAINTFLIICIVEKGTLH